MMISRSVRLISPSGYCHNQPAALQGIARLRAAGHQVENEQVITRRFQRFAGTDAERLADINQLASLTTLPDVVLAVRGGYGASRLLESIDYVGLQRRLLNQSLALCGHSDFTAIQLALLAQVGLITFSAPMLAGNFGAATLSEFTLHHFWQALTSPTVEVKWQSETPDQGDWQGTLWGGNLAMICSLIGTPWMPQIENGILARQRAIVTGSFTSTALSDYDNGFDFSTVWQRVRDTTGLPVICGLDFGHAADTVTLPLGASARLAVSQGNAHLQATGHPVLRD